jgi:tripartite-type tricarboxylate transporter receptor subunit TctC
MSELGIQGMDLDTSLGLLGPAQMPRPVVLRIAQAARTVMAMPQVQSEFRAGGVEPRWAGSTEFAETIREADAGWARLVAAIGYKRQ